MKGGVMLNSQRMHTLLDLKATHPFVSYKAVNKLNILIGRLSRGLAFSTPLEENIGIDDVYEGCIVLINECRSNWWFIDQSVGVIPVAVSTGREKKWTWARQIYVIKMADLWNHVII